MVGLLLVSGATANAQVPAETLVLPEVSVTGEGVRSTDPVQGIIADVAGSGTKTDTPLMQTPQSISVITRDDFEARGAQNLNQVLRYTAGVAPDQRGATAVRLDQMSVRGFSPERYLDGLRLPSSRDASPSVDPFRLERVEVIRGPASVLYGQASPGGLVSLLSKRPTDAPFRELLLQGGSYNTARVGLDVSGALDEDREFLGRLTTSYYRSDTQLDGVKESHWFVQPSITWRPSEDTTLTVLGNYQHDPDSGAYGSLPVYGTVLPNPNGRISRRLFDGDSSYERLEREQYSVGYHLEHRLNPNITLRQNTRYLHSHGMYRTLGNEGYVSRDYLTATRTHIGTDVDIDALTIDNQAVLRFDTWGASHTVLVGVDAQRTLTDTYSYNGGRVSPYYLFEPRRSVRVAYPAFTSYGSVTAEQFGVYAQDQIQIGQLHLLLGLRRDWADSHSETTALTTGRVTPSDRSDQATTGRAAALYEFDFGLSPYVSYSESFQPSTSTTAPQRGSTLFEPTTGRQYEIGFRYQPPGTQALFSFAAFDLLQDGLATTDPLYPTYSIQQGQIRTRGFEVEGKVELADGLSLIASYGYLDARRQKDNGTQTVNYMLEGVPAGPTVSLNGKRPTTIPEHTASSWLSYTFARDTALRGLTIGGGARYVGSTFGDSANTLRIPGYVVFDAAANYDFGEASESLKGLRGAINVQNLTDKTYVTSCVNYAWCWYGNSLTVLASLRYNF